MRNIRYPICAVSGGLTNLAIVGRALDTKVKKKKMKKYRYIRGQCSKNKVE